MKLYRGTNNYLFIIPAMFLMLLASRLEAQNPANFSGTWNLDNSKSDGAYKEYQVTCRIKQD
jgi:hypothetical protein